MKRRAAKSGQNRTKSARRSRFNVSAPQIARIRLRHVAGQSNREIAFAEGRCRDTVAKVVNAADFSEYIGKMQEDTYSLAPEAILSLKVALKLDSSGRLSYDLLKDLGVIPDQRHSNVAQAVEEIPPTSEEDAIMRESIKLAFLTINQAKTFNQPLPNLDGVKLDEAEFERLRRLNNLR